MSSYAGILTFAILLVTIVPAIYMLWYNNQISTTKFSETLIHVGREFTKRSMYNILINESSISWAANSYQLTFWVLNTGSASIPVKDFPYIDVILKYTTKSGVELTLWIPYDPDGVPGNEIFWRVIGVKTGSSFTEAINPLYPSPNNGLSPTSGMWDPGEELLFEINLTPKYAADTTVPVAICIVLKCGIETLGTGGA